MSWNLALILGEVVRVTLLFYLAPVWATLLAVALLRRAGIGWLRVISVALGLAGAVVLLGFAERPAAAAFAGDWLGLAAGVLFAAVGHAGAQGRDDRRPRADHGVVRRCRRAVTGAADGGAAPDAPMSMPSSSPGRRWPRSPGSCR